MTTTPALATVAAGPPAEAAAPAASSLQVDRAALAARVRDSTGRPRAALLEWTVQPLTGGYNGAAVYRLAGTLADGAAIVPWSLVLKMHHRPAAALQQAIPGNDWRREAYAYRSRLHERFPEGFRAARCLGVDETADEIQIWLEDLTPATRQWTLADFRRAALQLGRLSGACAAPHTPARAQFPWLSEGFLPMWLSLLDASTLDDVGETEWQHPLKPISVVGDVTQRLLTQHGTWDHPLVRAAYPPDAGARLVHLWRHRWQLVAALARLPQTLVHGDARPANLFLPSPDPTGDGAGGELVAVDWELVGHGAVGEDAGHLLALAIIGVGSLEEASQREATIVTAYLQGLRAVGWQGDAGQVRLVCAAHVALTGANWYGSRAAAFTDPRVRALQVPPPARPIEQLAAVWGWKTGYFLALAEEAAALLSLA